MRLLVTRPLEDAETLERRLAALGHRVIMSPLLTIAPRADIAIPPEPYQAIALTSANAIRCLESSKLLDGLRDLPVLAVGPQSAAAARQAGFARITEAGGDGIGLARHIIGALDPKAGPVLYLSGLDTASDFTGLLEKGGISARRVIVYEAKPATSLAPEVADAEGVLLYSPRSARIWLDLAERQSIAADVMVHYCLSANIAAILPDAFARRVAARPVEDAMLEIIGRADGLA